MTDVATLERQVFDDDVATMSAFAALERNVAALAQLDATRPDTDKRNAYTAWRSLRLRVLLARAPLERHYEATRERYFCTLNKLEQCEHRQSARFMHARRTRFRARVAPLVTAPLHARPPTTTTAVMTSRRVYAPAV